MLALLIMDGINMKKLTGLIAFCIIYSFAWSQDASIRKLQSESLRSVSDPEAEDTIKKNWKTGAIYTISGGQGSLSNWAAGGDDFTLSLSTTLNLYGFYKKNRSSWDNAFDLNFGYIKSSSIGSRKNDDRIDFLSKYGQALNCKLNLTSLVNFRTQLLKGYSYGEDPKGFPTKSVSSSFMSPAYLLVSQGLDYKPRKGFSVFVSPMTSRWVIVNDDSLAARGDYGVPAGKNSSNQIGAFATVHYQKSFNKYVSYRGRVDLFSNYKKSPGNVDMYLTNTVTAKVAKIIAFTWNLDMIYDDDVQLFGKSGMSPALQLKSMIGVGLQVKI
jgi:hypothetical protein